MEKGYNGKMNLWWHIGILIVFGFVLLVSAQLVVRSAIAIAKRLGLTNFTIGFLLLGILTSTPEFFVAIQSAISGVPQLSTGNLIGGQILILSLLVGMLAVVLGKVVMDHEFHWQDLVSTSAVIAAPALVLWDGALTRGEGVFLLGSYFVHALLLSHDGKRKHVLRHHKLYKPVHHVTGIWLFLLGVIGLSLSSHMIVTSAQVLIQALGIVPLVFGLFVLSIGTNLPELALAVRAIPHGRKDIALGDIIGSAAANTLILGFLGLVSPYRASPETHSIVPALVLLTSVTAYFLWSFWTGKSINRKEGIGLLLFYGMFILFELWG